MEVSYTQAVANFEDYIKGRAEMTGFSLELSKDLEKLAAIDAIEAIDENPTFRQRAEIVRRLLMNNTVTLKHNGKPMCTFVVTQGFQWFSVNTLNDNPYALKFIITTVFGMFLKQCAPCLTDSQTTVQTVN